jgi:monoamine oxidase
MRLITGGADVLFSLCASSSSFDKERRFGGRLYLASSGKENTCSGGPLRPNDPPELMALCLKMEAELAPETSCFIKNEKMNKAQKKNIVSVRHVPSLEPCKVKKGKIV